MSNRRNFLRKLRKAEPTGLPCMVPGCPDPNVHEDVCYNHARQKPHRLFLPNDGIIDWTAVEVAASGSRVVRLTWVEAEIAGGMILAEGHTMQEVLRRLGMVAKSGPTDEGKRDAYWRVADAIRCAA